MKIRFCGGITMKGYPCIRHAKNGSRYCFSHEKNIDEECGICYDDMQQKKTLSCGHEFCTSCLIQCSVSCPLCREKTNIHRKSSDDSRKILISLFAKFNNIDNNKDDRILLAHDIAKTIMRFHASYFADRDFVENFEGRMIDFSKDGMYTGTYLKQMSSYKQRKGLD